MEIRGLSTAGDEVELLARFQAAMFDEGQYCYLSLESDIESDAAIKVEKQELVSAEPPAKLAPKAHKTLRKRRTMSPDAERAETNDGENRSGKKPLAKKIKKERNVEIETTKHAVKKEKTVIKKSTANGTSKPKSSEEARKRQDILKMTAAARKQAWLKRFGPATAGSTTGIIAVPIDDDTIENIGMLKEYVVKMRKRAARYACYVAELENKIKMEKR